MKRRDFCKGLAVTLAAGALAPGAALPQAGAATALVGRAVPDDYYTLWYRSDRCSADLRHDYYYSDSLFDHAATEYDDKLALATLGMAAAADSSWESDQYYWMDGRGRPCRPYPGCLCKAGLCRGAAVQLYPQPERRPGHGGLCRCPQNTGARRQTGDHHRGVRARLRLWSRVVRQPSYRLRQRPHGFCEQRRGS